MCCHWKEKYRDDDNYNTNAPDKNKPCYLTTTVLEDTNESIAFPDNIRVFFLCVSMGKFPLELPEKPKRCKRESS